MLKKIISVIIVIAIAITCGMIYLNQVFLPTKIKSLVVSGLTEETQKRVVLGELKFHLFKGFVLRDLEIYDAQKSLLSIKEADCGFLIFPILRREIIIPSINIRQAVIFLQRRADNSFNLADLFRPREPRPVKKAKFNLWVRKVKVSSSRIDFQDDTLEPTFVQSLDQVNLMLYLSLPAKLNFTFASEIPGRRAAKIQATGEFAILRQELTAQITFADFSPREFCAYTQGLNLFPPESAFSGTLNLEFKDFKHPLVQLRLSSHGLALAGNFSVADKVINVSRLSGSYLNSRFSLAATLDTSTPAVPAADLKGISDISLSDLKAIFKQKAAQLEAAKLQGLVHAEFALKGNLNQIKNCAVGVALSSPAVSAFGLEATQLFLNYNQAAGLGGIPVLHLSLYDGAITSSAKINLTAENLPYWLNTDIRGIKIEKLKSDTAARDKDISGIIQGAVRLNGFAVDFSKISGTGNISMSDGKLWELNLFQGLGKLVFIKDFSNVIFHQGSADFIIRDRYITSDNLNLKSDLVGLSGSCKLGFDSSLDASINVQVFSDAIPLNRTFREVATAIVGESGTFGTIRISGTLKEPKYKFIPPVLDIINNLKNTLLKNILKP